MGVGTSWGVMQDYYEQHDFKDTPNANTILPFVGTVGLVFLNLMGPVAQIVSSRFGSRATLVLGTLCKGLGLIIAGWGKEPWQLIICQGLIFGSGCSFTYVTAMAVVPQWFNKRRSLAIGIVASGSGIGGLIMPEIMESINSTLGPSWTYRILGFVCLGLDAMACVMVCEKNASKPRVRKHLGDIIQLTVLKNGDFCIFCVASVISLLGYFVPYYYIPSFATAQGFSSAQGSNLLAVASACNTVGRVLAGFFGDRAGKLNVNIVFTIIAGLCSLLIWTFSHNYGTLMAYSALFGLFCGSYFALLSPTTAALVGMERYPTALSFLLITNIISVFGPNIASAIEAGVSAEPFFSYKMFSGVCYLVGAALLIVLKFKVNRNVFAKV
ncbi:major facilitator superfamily domain-containing protein [Absidia repens]|uniref:Major facilitator superfamily domain-containing protein n=1 Tax=Absidia repens TaxID=90262 RepID=A0A1X2IWZ8_9FUNG|nr:major facilitator superfamily domain-containing protein [Absidia repens]